ncbi:DUF429 domain-containing protein [Nakamurella antarctica]|nr:DUF429 domain-containing protein [Nakamurella antarctica]
MRTVVGIDWSGAAVAQERPSLKIWVAVVQAGILLRLFPTSRNGAREALQEMASETSDLIIGFDFAFGYPAWYAREHLLVNSARELWRLARADRALLAATPGDPRRSIPVGSWPFWRAGTPRPTGNPEIWRECDRHLRAQHDVHSLSSVFQFVGASQVGPATLAGMATLADLADDGFAIWPFDAPATGQPLVAEVWPRLAARDVVKSDPAARLRWVDSALHKPNAAAGSVIPNPDHRALILASDDAFDAVAAALWLDSLPAVANHSVWPRLAELPAAAQLEGWVLGVDRPA